MSIIKDWHRQQEERKYRALFVNLVMERDRELCGAHNFGVAWRFSHAFSQAAYIFAAYAFGCFPSDVIKHCEIMPGAITPSLSEAEVLPILNWFVGNSVLPEKFMTDRLARDVDYYLDKCCPEIWEQKLVKKYALLRLERHKAYEEEVRSNKYKEREPQEVTAGGIVT